MSFVSSYLDYTQIQETTERVHRWVALSIIAGAMERKTWLHRGTYVLYPNLYTFVIGPSGIVRKSTSTAIGMDLLRELPNIKIMSERLTAASLIQQFARSGTTFSYQGREIKQSASFAYGSELNVFLGEVFGSISELLTTFYDCQPNDSSKPWIYETISSGITRVYGPCLNFLGASTPTWLMRSIPPSEMEGGFASRVIFVVEDKARRAIAFPDLEVTGEAMESKRRFLLADLKRIHSLVGGFKLAPELIPVGQAWYAAHQQTIGTNTDQRFAGYYGRKFDTVLKVAMCISASESSDLIITVAHFDEAVALLQDVEARMFGIFGSRGENPNSELTERLMRFVRNYKRTTLSRIMLAFKNDATAERVCAIMDHLVAMKLVTKFADRYLGDFVITLVEGAEEEPAPPAPQESQASAQ